MKVTFVAKTNEKERWKEFELIKKEQNPFGKTPEGQPISINDLSYIITSVYYLGDTPQRNIQKFCLHATMDGYTDIRYYGQE